MEYIILEHTRSDSLATLVTQHLNDGWKLHGVPIVKMHLVCQALIKGDGRSTRKK